MYLVLVCILVGVCCGNTKDLSAEESLHKMLFSKDNYPDVHPIPINNTTTLAVTLDIQVIRVVEVNERGQSIQVYFWINQYWSNDRLTWNASEYGNITEIYVTKDKVWRPDIVLYNNADNNQAADGPMNEEYKTKIRLQNNGQLAWMNQALLHSICRIDVSYFPFDDQCCSLKFGSWAFDASKLNLKASATTGNINKFYIENGEWKLSSLNAKRHVLKYQCCDNPFIDVTITLQLRRHALNYALNLIVPCALLSSLVIMGYILPPESGERIGLTVALLLSVTVFQQLTNQIMPSYDFPYLAQYYWATIIQTGMSLVVTTIILNCYHRHHRRMHWLVRKIVLEIIGPCIICKGHRSEDEQDELEEYIEEKLNEQLHTKDKKEKGEPEHHVGKSCNNTRINTKSSKHIRTGLAKRSQSFIEVALQSSLETSFPQVKHLKQYEKKVRLERRQREWLKAAHILDRLFFILSLLTFFITLAGVFFRAPRFWNGDVKSQCHV